jgi:hypothetical protein
MFESGGAGRRWPQGQLIAQENVINSTAAATRAGRAKGATHRPNPALAGRLLDAGASALALA